MKPNCWSAVKGHCKPHGGRDNGVSNLKAKLQVQATISFDSWYLSERKQHLLLLAWPLRLPWDQWPLVSDVSCRLISQQDKWVSSCVTCLGLFPFLCKCPVIFPVTHTQLSLAKLTWTIPSDHCSFSLSSPELIWMATCLFHCACHRTKTAKCTWNDF